MLIPSYLLLAPRASIENATVTSEALGTQWMNPADVSTLLMVIGGDVVQKALAQGTAKSYFTPVCFSFGWVAYTFTALVNIIGEGRLLPPPDYPVKVFNLESGYVRENKNWVVGRILRDLESHHSKADPLASHALRIIVYDALPNPNGPTQLPLSKMHLIGLLAMLLQLGLAVIPVALAREWDILLITAIGTLLAQLAGSLPQWRAEKLPNRQKKTATFALTQGNGSRDIIVIRGQGNCLDLEELSASQSPRCGRPWEKFESLDFFSRPQNSTAGKPELPRADTWLRRSRNARGFPTGFWITRVVVVLQSVLWLLLLVNVASPRDYNWILLSIGAIGMFQNGFLAAVERPTERRNLPIKHVRTITATKKVMDGIMDFETVFGNAEPLLREFFPGKLRPAEAAWWKGERDEYDSDRRKGKGKDGRTPPALR